MGTIILVKFFIGLFFLIWASKLDMESRMVPNRIWKLFLIAILPFTAYEIFLLPHSMLEIMLGIIQFFFVSGLAITFYYLGFYGGADAKALIALSVAYPFYPQYAYFPLLLRGFSFSFSTLANSVLFAPFFAVYFLLINLIREGIRGLKETPLYYFIGKRVDADLIPDHHSLLEFFDENGKLVRVRRAVEPDDKMIGALKKGKERGEIERIWVTPQIPFIVFITIGYAASFFLGDVLSFLVTSLIQKP